MAEEEQDQIVFVMVGGERRFHKSVGAGVGQPAVEDILRLEARWIESGGVTY